MNTSSIWRFVLCGLSIALLSVLGMVGDELPNLVRARFPGGCRGISDLPYPSMLVLDIFGENRGRFGLSLTPLMIVFGGLAACLRGDSRINTFWSGFAATWLLALIYFGLYFWALLLPFHLLCADLEDRPLDWIVPAINVGLLITAVIVFWRGRQAR